MGTKVIKVAAREKRRMVNAAVGKNFLKTITEPLTNSDSILKKQAGGSHAAGLVDELLKLKRDERLDTSVLKKRIPKQPRRRIVLELTTAGANSRLCRISDTGLGMSEAELETKFGSYAEAKARGERTRSLFGRGALDVLLYHDESVIYSSANGKLSRCKIYWANDAMIETEELGYATKGLLAKYKLPSSILPRGLPEKFPRLGPLYARLPGYFCGMRIASKLKR